MSMDIKLFTHAFLGRARTLKAIHSSDHLVLGPWISEVGPEVQYWIPFLQQLIDTHHLRKENLTVISRGGTALWYKNVTDRYLDVFDYMSLEEFRVLDAQRKRRKHLRIGELDRVILERASRDLGQHYGLVHPSFMNRMFAPFWCREKAYKFIKPWMRCMRVPMPDFDPLALNLPQRYIAAKFYFSENFPNTEKNKNIVASLLKKISKRISIVLLDTGFTVDDHREDYSALHDSNIFTIRDHVDPRNNLDIQTRVLSHAEAFIGTYGGFSCIAPLYGVPSFALYSENRFPRSHMDVAQRVYSHPPFASYIVLDIKDIENIERIFSL